VAFCSPIELDLILLGDSGLETNPDFPMKPLSIFGAYPRNH